MRILTIAPADSPHTIRPVRSLLKRGHSICLFGYHAQNPFECEDWPQYTWVADPAGEPMPLTDDAAFKSRSALQAVYRAFQPDVIHIHWISWHLPLCASLHMRPLVISIWGSDLNCALCETSLGKYAWKGENASTSLAKSLPLADHLIVDDPSMLVKCSFAAPHVSVSHLSPGVDKIFFEADAENITRIRSRLRLSQKYIFIAPRLLSPTYRIPEIMRAFALAARNTDSVLILKKYLTKDQFFVQRLRDLSRHLGIESQVRIYSTLSQQDLRDLYCASTALINFPIRDAFPVTFAEAAACGARMITCWHPAYDVPLVKRFFDILPDDRVESLAKAIREYITNPPAEDIIRCNLMREMAYTEYSHEKYMRELLSLYASLVTQRSRT